MGSGGEKRTKERISSLEEERISGGRERDGKLCYVNQKENIETAWGNDYINVIWIYFAILVYLHNARSHSFVHKAARYFALNGICHITSVSSCDTVL
jgi:hypothetical protein